MESINAIVAIPLHDLQTEKAKQMDVTTGQFCVICGKRMKEGHNKMVQLLTAGNIVSSDQPFDNSQGFFPVGNDCAKKLIIHFAF